MEKITETQLNLIRQFSCERLSRDPGNRALIQSFSSKRGESLVDYLQNWAWDEDEAGHTAVYLIKAPNGEPVLFFSLKCGALFSRIREESLRQRKLELQELFELLKDDEANGRQHEAQQLIEYLRSGNISIELFRNKIQMQLRQAKAHLSIIQRDREQEWNPQIIQVDETFSAIEIMHFCSCDSIKSQWSQYNIRYPFGQVMFWYYIAPIIYQTQERIGCQYAYLFAADTSEDGALVNYYNVALKFEKPDGIGTSKPQYDFCCEFMCQEINELQKNREAFFDQFNPGEDDSIV